MVLNVVFPLQSLKSIGARLFFGAFAVSSSGYFSREEPREYEEMTRARMTVTRVCINHVDNVEAGKSHSITGDCLAHMMYECVVHQVTIIGGDANKMAYQKQGQQLDGSFVMSTFQFWLDRFEQTIDAYFKKTVPQVCRDLSVRQFHSASFLDFLELREKVWWKGNILDRSGRRSMSCWFSRMQ